MTGSNRPEPSSCTSLNEAPRAERSAETSTLVSITTRTVAEYSDDVEVSGIGWREWARNFSYASSILSVASAALW